MSMGLTCNCVLGNVHHDVNSVWLEEMTMGKLIIDNRSSVDDVAVLSAVRRAMSHRLELDGGLWNSYVTVLEVDSVQVRVVLKPNKRSDKCVVVDEKHRS